LIIYSAFYANNSAIDSIEKIGKLADFVVIPVDYMTIPAEDRTGDDRYRGRNRLLKANSREKMTCPLAICRPQS